MRHGFWGALLVTGAMSAGCASLAHLTGRQDVPQPMIIVSSPVPGY